MAKGLNRVTLIGNLVADPESFTTASGTTIARVRFVTPAWIQRDGNWEDVSEFHRVVAFGRIAEIIVDRLKKGDRAYFEGRLQTRQWTDDDGNRKWSTEIIVGHVIPLLPKQQKADDKQDDMIPF